MINEFEYNGKAMGTEYFISIVCDSKDFSDKMYQIAKRDIEQYEFKFSRFLPASELSILNEKKSMNVSKTFLDVTIKAYQLFVKTKGIFNPLVQISRLGYTKSFDEFQFDKIVENEDFYDIDFSSVVINEVNSRITLKEGQKLDYGGFLKGYVSEIIAKKIKAYSDNILGVIVNIGGDIYTEGLDKDGNKFIFNIYNPILKDSDIIVHLYNQALATSGIYKRTWVRFGKKFHHILDATGNQNPKSEIVSSSVVCCDGSMAEAYTKVFLSMGDENALKLLDDKDILFVLIKNNGQIINNIK
jgi:thiamine biosynthesis lipoprotein